MSEREAQVAKSIEDRYKPSGTATSSFMPFRPASSNPLKLLESEDWNLYVMDLVSIPPVLRREEGHRRERIADVHFSPR